MQRDLLSPKSIFITLSAFLVIGVFVWQGVTSSGAPAPTGSNLSPTAGIINTGILVFREGLEAILVLSAITASLVRNKNDAWKPISIGAGLSFGATLITWLVLVGIISLVGTTTSELNIQAGTGLLANIVLLVIMNWFFHKIYWTGWINHHNQRKRQIMDSENDKSMTYKGLVIVGLTSVYREGFEVVLFLQSIRLQVGSHAVLIGASIGLALTLIVGVLTFYAHQRLPYKKMLVFTGAMLGAVLFVMVGETVQEMQLAHWIPTTEIDFNIPEWMGLWFAFFPTVESISAQVLAVVYVLGTYFIAQYLKVWRPRKLAANQSVSKLTSR